MGVFQRYIKKDKEGNPIFDQKGKPKREGPWFIQYPYSRDAETGKITYRTEKASFNKKKAEKIFHVKTDSFAAKDRFGIYVDHEMGFNQLIDWGLNQEVMKVKASARDDANRAEHLKSYFGNHKAAQITPLDVDNFRIKMRQTESFRTGRPYSGTTVNKVVSLARRIYYLAMDAGIVKNNPFARRGAYKENPKGQYIPDSEFWNFYQYMPKYLQPVTLIAYLTGMRRGEVIGLKWDRVNLDEGYIDLTPDDTKTNEPRRIYFNSVRLLKNVLVEAWKLRKPGQKLVFTKSDGNPISKWGIRPPLIRACKKANVGPYRLHDLRHTFATNMRKAGVDQVAIMKLTGHKTFAMFLRYSHLDQEQSEIAMGKLNGFLSPGNTKACFV